MISQVHARYVDVHNSSPSSLIFRRGQRGLVATNAARLQNVKYLECSAIVFGLSMPVVGVLIYFVGSAVGLEGSINRAIALVLTVALGWIVYSFAAQGMVQEVEIDETNREIGVISRNSKGKRISAKTYPLCSVLSVFVQRSKTKAKTATLNIRLRKKSQKIQIIRGSEDDLAALLDQIVRLHVCGTAPRAGGIRKL